MNLLDTSHLDRTRQLVRNGDPSVKAPVEKLRSEANAALTCGPWSVMDKTMVPPGGDKHDFLSLGIYWWPNPDSPDGMPYVWRDGEANPAYFETDGGTVKAMTDALETLGPAYYLTGDERYAAHTARILRTWFTDPETGMNPHLRYAQGIPGKCEGRPDGLVSITQLFYSYPDLIAMIRDSEAWTGADEAAMKQWFREFLHWTLTDDFGKAAAAKRNNHGTWCDIMVCTLALYTGQTEIARRVLEAVPEKIIADQIDPDGKLPHELWRTRSFLYSIFNLQGLVELATLADPMGIDLWNYETADGRGIRKVVDWMAQYAHPDSDWPYPELDDTTFRTRLYSLLHRAALVYTEPCYNQVLQTLPDSDWKDQRFLLLYESLETKCLETAQVVPGASS